LILTSYYFNGERPSLQDAMCGFTRGSLSQILWTQTNYLIESITSENNPYLIGSIFENLHKLFELDVCTLYKKRISKSNLSLEERMIMLDLVPKEFFRKLEHCIVFSTVIHV
jgi:hypothetical protein